MRFVISSAASIRVTVVRQSTGGVVRVLRLGMFAARATVTVTWDGRNARGLLVQPGLYSMTVYTTDARGHTADRVFAALGVNYRRIVVHLDAQRFDAYNGTTLLRSTLVTTGNKLLPTPAGIWHVGAKFHPYTFISPWKRGSPYYYEPAKVNYALYFHQGGYFIHDAPWRTVFGPGTNTAPGPPGIYSGTHGCINVPIAFGRWLYAWAAIGTVVDIRS